MSSKNLNYIVVIQQGANTRCVNVIQHSHATKEEIADHCMQYLEPGEVITQIARTSGTSGTNLAIYNLGKPFKKRVEFIEYKKGAMK